MKYHFSLLTILIYTSIFAQDIQWASSVKEVSTEFNYEKYPGQYLAKEALGAPSTLTRSEANPCAWAPAKENNWTGEFIELGFEKPQFAQMVLIHETFNAGAVSRVIIKGEGGKSQEVYRDSINTLVKDGRMLHVKFPRTSFKVSSVRIELETAKISGFNQIDAVGLADHQRYYEVKVNVNPAVEKEEVKVTNLGSAINSATDDLSPVIAPNGKTLYFTRQNHPNNVAPVEKQDIWFSEVDEKGNFSEAKNLGEPLCTPENNSTLSITPDGQHMLVLNQFFPDKPSGKGISISTKGPNGWGFPEPVKIDEYENLSSYGEYSLSNSGNVIVMTVMTKESEGNKDLYVSFKKEDNSWTKPLSLGGVVNTAASEISPFIAADERSLYFSSSGHPGYGGSDIFVTRRLDDSWQNWSEPENLGPYLNSPKFDAYYTLPAKGDKVYFVSYRDGGYGSSDIYYASVPVSLRPDAVALVKGKVFNKKTGETIETEIEYYALSANKKLGEAKSDAKDGSYEIILPSGEKYGFFARKDGFLPVSAEFELLKKDGYQEKEVNLYLVPIEKDASIVINNVYFDTDKFDLRKESFVELDQLAGILKAYPNMKVELSGHTDDVGNDAYNQTLSDNRAKSVKNYLVSKGITADRLQSKGYGESKPITPNVDDSSRQMNRRVEFKIIEL